MADIDRPGGNPLIWSFAFLGGIAFQILNFSTKTVPGGISGGFIGGLLGGSVGFLIHFLVTSQTPQERKPSVAIRLGLFPLVVLMFSAIALIALDFWITFLYPNVFKFGFDDLRAAWNFPAANLRQWISLVLAGVTLISGLACFGRSIPSAVISMGLCIGAFMATDPVLEHFFHHDAPLPPRAIADHAAGSLSPQQRAVAMFPPLAVASSPLNQEFVRRFRQYQQVNKAYFNDPEWPTHLAQESDAALRKH